MTHPNTAKSIDAGAWAASIRIAAEPLLRGISMANDYNRLAKAKGGDIKCFKDFVLRSELLDLARAIETPPSTALRGDGLDSAPSTDSAAELRSAGDGSLLPCPFCNAKQTDPEFDDNGSGPPPSMYLRCDACGATGPFGYGKERRDYPGARVDAIKQWNTRSSTSGTAEGWQLIETAPKDGTRFIGWQDDIPARETCWDFYGEGSMAFTQYRAGEGPSGFWSDYTKPGWCLPWHPTHWMPLPSSPPSERVSEPAPPSSGGEA